MPEPDDISLLRQYAEGGSEPAFATLVEKYVNLVYSTALRNAGYSHAAEEITQAVFIILARKANKLPRRVVLSGWLYQTTRLTTANFLRTEIRRQKREQEAYMQSLLNEREPEVWPQIAPLLDAAMERLGEKDRNAIVLRFFENRNLRDVGLALGASEDAAKMRVNRALEKLRKFFTKRGVTLSALAIAGAVSTHPVQAAPAALAKSITAVAVAKGAAASGSTLTLVKGALKFMAWTKAKITAITVVGILLAAGTTTITVKEVQAHRTYPWQVEPFDFKLVDQQPPEVKILRSRAKSDNWDRQGRQGKMMGLGMTTGQIVLRAYGVRPVHTVQLYQEPAETYDFIASLPDGNEAALQQELKRKMGIVAHREMIKTNVLVLAVASSRAPGLRPAADPGAEPSFARTPGQLSIRNGSLSRLLALLEGQFQKPIVNQTDLTNHLDIDLQWNDADATYHNPAVLKQVTQQVKDQLGLELVPGREPVEMLVVEKAN